MIDKKGGKTNHFYMKFYDYRQMEFKYLNLFCMTWPLPDIFVKFCLKFDWYAQESSEHKWIYWHTIMHNIISILHMFWLQSSFVFIILCWLHFRAPRLPYTNCMYTHHGIASVTGIRTKSQMWKMANLYRAFWQNT